MLKPQNLIPCLALAVLLAGCPNAYKVAWPTTASVMRATQSADKGLAAGSKAELDAGGNAVVICKRLATYKDVIRPAARSAVAAAYAGLRIAQEAGKKPPNYLAILKPGACGLILGLREWGHKLPDKGAGILPYLEAFSGVVCDKPASAIAIITALLPVVIDLVKWIVDLVGAPAEKLQQEINTWLQGPVATDVDALIKARCPAVR